MEYLRDAAKRMELTEAVYFPGYVPDADFVSAVTGLSARLSSTSLYEGFGIPVLEAMALANRCFVAVSRASQKLRATQRYIFDPRKPAEMVSAIEHIESDAEVGLRLIHLEGMNASRLFGGPTEMAQRYLQVFREVARDFHYPTLYMPWDICGWLDWQASSLSLTVQAPHGATLRLVLTSARGALSMDLSAQVRHDGHAPHSSTHAYTRQGRAYPSRTLAS